MIKNILYTGIALIVIYFLTSCSAKVKDKFSYSLIPVQLEDKWGYIDNKGKFIINPQFKKAYLFTDGIAVVQSKDGKFGWIGEDGKYIINPIYKNATNFSEGLAFVVFDNGFPTCINKKGEIQFILKEASYVGVFENGFAYVTIKDKNGFVDKTGKITINFQFDQVGIFSEGLAMIKQGENWGFINSEGKILINPQFKSIGCFSEGKAYASNEKKYGYIDKKGIYIINPQFDEADNFSDGIARVKQGESWGLINSEGKIVVNPQFEEIFPFKNGLAAVKFGKDNWGYIDKTGKIVINPQFMAAGKFYGDFAPVVSGDKIGLIDKQGKYVVNPQFSDIFSSSHNIYSGKLEFDGDGQKDGIFSDYFDFSEIISKLLENSKNDMFRGLSRQTSLHLLNQIDDYKNKLHGIKNSKYTAICLDTTKLSKEVTIQQTAFITQTPIYEYIGESKHTNSSTLIESIEYKIELESFWGNQKDKGKILAEGIKTELIKIYNGEEINDKSDPFSNSDSSKIFKMQMGDEFSIIEDIKYFFVSSSKINFSICYSKNSIILLVRFKP